MLDQQIPIYTSGLRAEFKLFINFENLFRLPLLPENHS